MPRRRNNGSGSRPPRSTAWDRAAGELAFYYLHPQLDRGYGHSRNDLRPRLRGDGALRIPWNSRLVAPWKWSWPEPIVDGKRMACTPRRAFGEPVAPLERLRGGAWRGDATPQQLERDGGPGLSRDLASLPYGLADGGHAERRPAALPAVLRARRAHHRLAGADGDTTPAPRFAGRQCRVARATDRRLAGRGAGKDDPPGARWAPLGPGHRPVHPLLRRLGNPARLPDHARPVPGLDRGSRDGPPPAAGGQGCARLVRTLRRS